MIKQEPSVSQLKIAPKGSGNTAMEFHSPNSRLARRMKSGKANANKLTKNKPFTASSKINTQNIYLCY
jgi:hypothetical protein